MNTPLYKEYKHAYIDPRLQVGDKLLCVDNILDDVDKQFYTGIVTELDEDGLLILYSDESSPHGVEFISMSYEDFNIHILRLLPEEIFGETILYSQLSNEYIHLVKQLGYTGRLKDIDDLADKKEYTV